MKGLRVTKIVKVSKFEGVWGELEAKKSQNIMEVVVGSIFFLT